MSKDIFSKLYYESGWTKTDANALFVYEYDKNNEPFKTNAFCSVLIPLMFSSFRCADTTKRGGLSFRDFLCIYAVTEPSKSSITSNDIRNKYIFRYVIYKDTSCERFVNY